MSSGTHVERAGMLTSVSAAFAKSKVGKLTSQFVESPAGKFVINLGGMAGAIGDRFGLRYTRGKLWLAAAGAFGTMAFAANHDMGSRLETIPSSQVTSSPDTQVYSKNVDGSVVAIIPGENVMLGIDLEARKVGAIGAAAFLAAGFGHEAWNRRREAEMEALEQARREGTKVEPLSL